MMKIYNYKLEPALKRKLNIYLMGLMATVATWIAVNACLIKIPFWKFFLIEIFLAVADLLCTLAVEKFYPDPALKSEED